MLIIAGLAALAAAVAISSQMGKLTKKAAQKETDPLSTGYDILFV